MLLRKTAVRTDYRRLIGIGQLCLCLGILLSHVGRGIRISDFSEGLLLGVGTVLMLVSIPFNITGMKRYRNEKDRK